MPVHPFSPALEQERQHDHDQAADKPPAGSCNIVNRTNIEHMHRPMSLAVDFTVECDSPAQFGLKFRIPWWVKGDVKIYVNGELQDIQCEPSGFCTISRTWGKDKVSIELPKGLTACPLPGDPETVAFMEGPIVLAGLCDGDCILHGDPGHPETILTPDDERKWSMWNISYRTRDHERNIRFVPLYDVGYEKYTVYFRVKSKNHSVQQPFSVPHRVIY